MLVFKIIGIGICGTVLALTVKQYRPELAIAVPVLSAAAILLLCVPYLSSVLTMFQNIAEESGIDTAYVKIVIKIIGVAYICQFASDICKDAGESSIAGKIELGGKVVIITLSMPIIYGLLELTSKIISF
ncbi:MAG: stage III sporulation protein AD [Clostridiales bacterium]|nr:stage III sporulation protein AD [Clostridiales bacterium]